MPGKWLRLAALLTVAFGTMIGLVRARPADDPDLRTFLIPPDNCRPPCFLGVQPGITTVDDAMAILEASAWIADVEPSASFYDLHWSGSQPDFIDAGSLNYFMAETQVVGQIRLRTRLRLGDVYGLLGKPDASYWLLSGSGSGVFHALIYTRLGVEVSGYAPCPTHRQDLWRMPVEVRLHNPAALLVDDLGMNLFEQLGDIC